MEARDDHPHAAFERLFRETRDDLLAFALRRSPSPEEAADAVAETYLIAWRRLERVPSGAEARLWLFGVARNVLRKGATRRHRRNRLVDRLARELRAGGVGEPSPARDRLEAIRRALARLPARDRELLTLTAWEGLTAQEIASITGMSANVVRVRLHRARKRLKKELARPRRAVHRTDAVALERD
jgi:RNA polymerase sigma factor (sigma-70 family)